MESPGKVRGLSLLGNLKLKLKLRDQRARRVEKEVYPGSQTS